MARFGSILKRPIIKMTERSDFHKYSIFNSQYSIVNSGLSGFGEEGTNILCLQLEIHALFHPEVA